MAKHHDPKRVADTSDFCFLNGRSDARLSDVERLTMVGGGGLDRVLQRLARTLEQVSLESFSSGLDVQTLLGDLASMRALRQSGAIAQLFDRPVSHPKASIVPVHGFPYGSVLDLEFASPFPVGDWKHDRGYSKVVENRTSYVRLWEHNDDQGQRPTIVAVHGWTMGDQRVNSLAFMPGLFYRLGCNVALVELPFHGRRRPVGLADDVPLFPSIDPIKTCLAMAHALYDLRTLSSFLEIRGHSRISCLGMSLGAYVGALWAALDELHRAVLLVPLVSMGDMAHELVVKRYGRASREAKALSLEMLRELFSDHYALTKSPQTPQESVLVIRGKGDQLVSRGQIALLRKSWPHATYLWSEGGHGAPVSRGETFTKMTRFLLEDER